MIRICFICLLSIPICLGGQTSFTSGILSKVTGSHSLNKSWKLTGQIENIQQIGPAAGVLRTDFTLLISRKVSPGWAVSSGYLHRVSDARPVRRLLQQVAFSQTRNRSRLGHRIRTDQTFSSTGPVRFRLRYRFSSEIALQGATINAQEWYLVMSSEALLSHRDSETDFEQRLVANLGHYFDRKHKIQLGFDYRLDRLLVGPSRHRLWWVGTYFTNF